MVMRSTIDPPGPAALGGRAVVLGLVCCILCILAGCSSHRTYRAAKLPAALAAPAATNTQTIDLSRLASFTASSAMVAPGDVLEVTLVSGYEDRLTTTPVRVGDDGLADVPLVGRVPLAGLELPAAEQAIRAAAIERGLYRNPHVTVTMKQQRMNLVTVVGAVGEPGVYELPRGKSSLLAALVSAGGLSEDAGPDVEIRHPVRQRPGPAGPAARGPTVHEASHVAETPGPNPAESGTPPGGPHHAAGPHDAVGPHEATDPHAPGQLHDAGHPAHVASATGIPHASYGAEPVSYRVNLVTAAATGNGGHYLDDGAVVMVHKRAPQPIHVMGRVARPGQFELPQGQDLRLLDALALAGGTSVPWADKVIVIRQQPSEKKPVVIAGSIREAKFKAESNVRLAPGDIVSVEDSAATALHDVLNFVRPAVGASFPLF